mgnify:CR=1 FL=1
MRNYIFILLGTILGFGTSCDGMLDNIQPYLEEGETIYVGKVDSLEAFSGKNRVKLEGLYLYGVTQKKCVIRWKSMDEEEMSLNLDVVRENPEDPFEVIIDNLDEGQYEFVITTYDAKGNSSIESMVECYVYGELYESNLSNRKIDSWSINGTSLEINWRPVNDAQEVEFYYLNREGVEVERIIPVSETRTVIDDCAYKGEIRWRTVYLPEKNAIDKFYSEETIENYSFYVERELDKSRFSEKNLVGDISMGEWGTRMSNMWNGIYGYDDNDFNHSADFRDFPQSFTFDLGVTNTKLTRFKIWQRGYDWFNHSTIYLYNNSNIKKWEIYGCADAPSADGSWEGWTKLTECEMTKPSNTPLGTLTDEDMQAAKEGHEFVFPENIQPVRYLRFKILDTWGSANDTGNHNFYIKEVTFYGIEQFD